MNENEIWIPIEGYEYSYQVSNKGRVRSIDRSYIRNGCVVKLKGKVLAQTLSKRGYNIVKICVNGFCSTKTTHRFIAQAFIPNPKNYTVINHINGIKSDNRLLNLEWCTNAQNIIHALNLGLITRPKGENANYTRKLICTDTGKTYSTIKEAAADKNINISTLRCYVSGNRKNKTTLVYA